MELTPPPPPLYLSEATWIENKYQCYDLNSDEINRSVHYVHHILEQKKKLVMKIALVEIRTHDNKRDVHESDA